MPKATASVRIIGLDPGVARTGFACLEMQGSQYRILEFGCIETPKTSSHSDRLMQLEKELQHLIAKHRPTVAAIEKLFFYKNVTTAMSVGQARGVIVLTLARNKLVPIEFTPQQVKLAATGYGNAEKKQIQQMMKRIFNLPSLPTPDDAADALAIAFTASSMTTMPHA